MHAGKAAPADSAASEVSARAAKAIQAHRAENEAAHADKAPHADKAQQARHSSAAQALDDAESGVTKPGKPHAVQGKATEAVAHATVHTHQEVRKCLNLSIL